MPEMSSTTRTGSHCPSWSRLRISLVTLIATLVAAVFQLPPAQAEPVERPNIVLIMADGI